MQAIGPTQTTCPYCGVGCGVIAGRDEAGAVVIVGDPDHPANFGRLCSKGSALAETVGLEGRLLHPVVNNERVGWNEALDEVAARFSRTIAEYGPDSVAFYVSGQLLTEDYYVANKLMKGFIGSANIDTNSRLCMASSVAGHRRAFGVDAVPGCYEDLEEADLVILVGSNLAWCHPVLYQRLMAARDRRPEQRIVVIDPRRSATASACDLHLAIAPDGDVPLFAGLLAELATSDRIDEAYVGRHTNGFDKAIEAAREFDLAAVARQTELAAADIATFYRWFIETQKVVTVYSQGVNQSVSGTDKVNAIINCHLATGSIGKPGMGPFSVTGQPNAMGGREVGGLANMLAAHLEIENADHRALVGGFWKTPTIAARPGLKAVELFQAIGDGRIKALWIMATNPVDSLPDADGAKRALAACPFVVVSDIVEANDTLPFAHVRLPAAGWGEKNGTVTNSERRISRQRNFLPFPGEARPDWWMVCEVARRMGFGAAFDFSDAAEIFTEHAALSSLANNGRPLDLGGLSDLGREGYDRLKPVQWPQPRAGGGNPLRIFGNGKFATPDGRARFVPTPWTAPVSQPSKAYPLLLNTGRIRDHWHTLTRTGRSARLWSHIAEPFIEIAPQDASAAGIQPATIVRVTSKYGSALLRAMVTDTQRAGSVFAPMHWTDQFSGKARVDALIGPAVDPISGQPGLKRTPVAVAAASIAWYGFAVSRKPFGTFDCDYWALAPAPGGGLRLELADLEPLADAEEFAVRLFGAAGTGDILSYRDVTSRQFRFVLAPGGRLEGALYIAPDPVTVSRAWVAGMLNDAANGAAAFRLLAGRPGADRPDEGAIVCSCHEVGTMRIAAAIAGGAVTLDAIAQVTRAGSNCGSCRAEIRKMIAHQSKRHDPLQHRA